MKCDRCSFNNALGARFCNSCGAELAINLVGEVLGDRYRVLSFVGSGGMGRVYRAEHTLLERPVAVKVLAPEYARDRVMWDRFRREALAAGRVAHPNIAATLDFGYKDTLVYSVMEYVDGTPLDAMDMPVPLTRSLDICRQIAQALGAAHDAGVVHRDVKPGNVIVCQLGDRDFIKVVDFGLAVLRINQSNPPITGPGMTMGTPAYVSPEQVLGETIDSRTDVYSLGAVLYQMLVGLPPFGYGDPATLAVNHAYKIPERPSSFSHLGDVPEDVDDFVMRLLAKDPDERPGNGIEVATELTQLLGQISSLIPALTRAERAICVVRFEHFEDIDEDVQYDVVATITSMGGRMARAAGDELLGIFDSATGAVAAAARLSASPGRSPAVAVHFGIVDIGAGGGVFGTVVNVALRMARLAAPGEALTSHEIRVKLDETLQSCLSQGGRLRLGDRARSVEIYRVTGFTTESSTDHPPVVVGEVRGKSTVAFTCACGYQGVIVVGKLSPGKAIRVRCNGCARQLSVVPRSGAALRDASGRLRDADPPDRPASESSSRESGDEDLLDSRTTNKMPEIDLARREARPGGVAHDASRRSSAARPEMSDRLIVDPPPPRPDVGHRLDPSRETPVSNSVGGPPDEEPGTEAAATPSVEISSE